MNYHRFFGGSDVLTYMYIHDQIKVSSPQISHAARATKSLAKRA